jgi:hypothetical protein
VFKDVDVELTIVSLRGFTGFTGLPKELEEGLRHLGHNVCYAWDVKYEFPEDVQNSLRRFCEGLKVCVE